MVPHHGEGALLRLGVLLALFATVSGCLAQGPAGGEAGGEDADPARGRPVVIAFIDSGTNPYLDAVQVRAEPDLSFLPAVTRVVPARSGDLTERLEADGAFWASATPGVLYHFAGTRLLAMGFTEAYPRVTFDSQAHGAVVTQLGALAAPESIILVLQVDGGGCAPPEGCLFDPSVAAAMEWAAAQPWIDVISSSIGLPGNPPDDPAVHPEMARWLRASADAAASGKIVISSAGNEPVPNLMEYYAGPPWVISVGGAHEATRGDEALATKGVDVIANFSSTVQSASIDGSTRMAHGTSFAAPIVAGTLANAMHQLRGAGAEYETAQLREALNATAVLFSPTDWRPALPDETWLEEGPVTSAPALTPAQTGWGYVDASLAPEIARRVLEGDLASPPEKAQTALFQERWQRAREEYWARYAT